MPGKTDWPGFALLIDDQSLKLKPPQKANPYPSSNHIPTNKASNLRAAHHQRQNRPKTPHFRAHFFTE
jgi:hypothetical protein